MEVCSRVQHVTVFEGTKNWTNFTNERDEKCSRNISYPTGSGSSLLGPFAGPFGGAFDDALAGAVGPLAAGIAVVAEMV